MTQLSAVSEGLKMKMLQFAGEPLASPQFIQEYNRTRSIEEELGQKLQQTGRK